VNDRAKLDASFVSLVLTVNGRVRPVDLQGIPEHRRVETIQAYYQANAGATPLHLEGDVLVRGASIAQAAPVETFPPAESPVSDYSAVGSLASAPAAPSTPGETDSTPTVSRADLFAIPDL